MKTELSSYLRDEHKGLRFRLIDAIFNILVANEGSLELKDNRGSLCYKVIDDQESEVIQSIAVILYPIPFKISPPSIVALIGVYDEDYSVDIEEFSCEMLLNVLEAAEREINN